MPFPILAAVAAAQGLAKMFGGAPEDKSTTGFDAYTSQNKLPYYPTKDELFRAGIAGGWESRIMNAINNYDQSTGVFVGNGDDWHQVVVSLNPIQVKTFKGAGESWIVRSTINANTPSASNAWDNTLNGAWNAYSKITSATGGTNSAPRPTNTGIVDINSNNNSPTVIIVVLGVLVIVLMKMFKGR